MYKPTGFIALPMLGLLVLVAAAIAIGSWWIAGKEEAAAPTISNFAECAAAGNAIMESYPRQCAANGQTFVEDIAVACEVITTAEACTLRQDCVSVAAGCDCYSHNALAKKCDPLQSWLCAETCKNPVYTCQKLDCKAFPDSGKTNSNTNTNT